MERHSTSTTGGIKQHFGRRPAKIVAIAAVVVAGTVPAALLASQGAGASGTARPAATPANPPALHNATPNGAAAVRAYWTPSRLAAAKPAVAHVSGQGVQASRAAATSGTPGVAGGITPGGVAGKTVRGAALPDAGTVTPNDGSYPGPNDTFDYPGVLKTFPTATIGKLFFTEPGGNFVCSAAATYGGGSLDMVWTAGHCVGPQGGGSYYANWLFCPQYKNKESAVGCWTWALAQQTGGWYFNGFYSADYAYLYMASSSDKVALHLANAVGGLGFAWNFGRDQFWQDFGYPSASPYNGKLLVVTSAEHRYDVTNPGGDSGPQDNSIGSQQTPGFSGGPWLLSFGPSNAKDPIGHGNYINSVNSYYFTSGGPGGGNEFGHEIQGPYFDTTACNFWKGGSGYGGTC
ncbi:MAG: trypsin-like serine peptidase [Actinomycetes bacterium]